MKRIVIKIGTATISKDNSLNYTWIKQKVKEIAALKKQGNEIIVVTSGAVAAGMELLSLKQRPKKVIDLQLLSGVGQAKLIKTFKDYFLTEKLNIMQVLLTHHNFKFKNEEDNIKSIIDLSLKKGIIPVINTNDVVTNEEFGIKNDIFPDNDLLAAIVAKNLDADLLLILTDVDGLCNLDPRKNACADLLEKVDKITPQIEKMATKEGSIMGTGGMLSKVASAKMIYENIPIIVGNGKNNIKDLIDNKVKRTIFMKE
jgi:glutamate 5-kinase